MTRTVVAFASAHGSTEGIARRIGESLSAAGHSVQVRSLVGPGNIDTADCLVLGSAIHNGQWLPDAERAAETLVSHSRSAPVWVFSVSSVGTTSSFLSAFVATRLRPRVPEPRAVSALRADADVRSHRFFAGAIAPGDWPGVGRILFRLMGGKYGDARDWDDIDQWTRQIIDQTTAPGAV